MSKLNIKPLADRVLVEPAAAETKTSSGIIIPDTAKEKPQKGNIVAVGPGTKDNPITVKVGDTVKVIAGDDKGSTGKVLKVIRTKNRVIVEGVAMVKKHNKPNSNNPKGGITEKESSIHISNVSLTTKDGEITRVGYRIDDDKKVRYSKKDNEII